jgi:hypothetical protein
VYLDPRKKGQYEYSNICFLYEPFYVGKGKDNRCYEHLKNNKRIDNKIFKNKINFLIKEGFNLKNFIISFNYVDNESKAYDNEICLIKEIGSIYINEIKDGTLVNICLYNQPPNLKGKSYQEIYGDDWELEIEKRRAVQIKVGGFFGGKKHSKESKNKISKNISGDKNPMWNKKHNEDTLVKMRKVKEGKYLGSNNPNKKSYKVISPDNDIFYIEGEVEIFCKEHNLSYSTLRNTLQTKKVPNRGKTKGWILEYNNLSENES